MLRFLGLGFDILMSNEILEVAIISPRRFQPRLFFLGPMIPVIVCFEFAFRLKPVFKVATLRTPLALPYLIGPIAQLIDLFVRHLISPHCFDDCWRLEPSAEKPPSLGLDLWSTNRTSRVASVLRGEPMTEGDVLQIFNPAATVDSGAHTRGMVSYGVCSGCLFGTSERYSTPSKSGTVKQLFSQFRQNACVTGRRLEAAACCESPLHEICPVRL
jgi:hypothetical protein